MLGFSSDIDILKLLIKELELVKSVAITTDGWKCKYTHRNYETVTPHYKNPICESKQATDANFNAGLTYMLDNINEMAVFAVFVPNSDAKIVSIIWHGLHAVRL